MDIGVAQAAACTSRIIIEKVDSQTEEAIHAIAHFTAEHLHGYAIVDTGATQSMTSVVQIDWLQGALAEDLGYGRTLEADHSFKVNFTFADGKSEGSVGCVGISHRCALPGDNGKIWFNMLENPKAPTLLGIQWLDKAGATVDCSKGKLFFKSGTSHALQRLPSGHWALSLFGSE